MGMIVCPGGGYGILAMNLEGTEICEWLSSIGVTAFLQRQDRKLRLHLTLNGVLMALHFMLLGATAAAINCLLCAVRTWVSGYYRGLGVMLFFLGMAWLLVMPQVEHPIQVLTLIGTTLSTYALFRLEGLALRLCMLSSTLQAGNRHVSCQQQQQPAILPNNQCEDCLLSPCGCQQACRRAVKLQMPQTAAAGWAGTRTSMLMRLNSRCAC